MSEPKRDPLKLGIRIAIASLSVGGLVLMVATIMLPAPWCGWTGFTCAAVGAVIFCASVGYEKAYGTDPITGRPTIDNPVTRCGEGLRPFVEACGNGRIEKMAKELLAKVDERKTATTTLDGGDEIYVNYAFYNARAISAAFGIEVPPPPAIYYTDKDGNIVPNPNPPPIER